MLSSEDGTERGWLRPLSLAIVAAMALVACGGDDDDSGASPGDDQSNGDVTRLNEDRDDNDTDVVEDVDACALLTRDEVEEALETPVGVPEPGATGPYETCTWNTEEVSLQFVIVQVQDDVSEDEFLTSAEGAAGFLDEDVQAIDGLGDSAFDLGGFLYAHEGEYEVVLTNVYGLDLENPDEEAEAQVKNEALMSAALSRLPD
jgi:hypothetical protein